MLIFKNNVNDGLLPFREITEEFELMSEIEAIEERAETESVIDLSFMDKPNYSLEMAHRPGHFKRRYKSKNGTILKRIMKNCIKVVKTKFYF